MDAPSNAKEDDSKWRLFSISKRTSLVQELVLHDSPSSSGTPRHVVVVYDAVEEFTMDPVEWVLKNVAFETSCKVTLLGVKPYLNIALSTKTSDIWAMNIEDFMATTECKSNPLKYQKVHRLIDVCLKYGVVPQIKTGMGYPVEEVVEQLIPQLKATLVVFDRHHRKYKEYYAEKIPCKMVIMKDDGEVDMIRGNRSSVVDQAENTLKQKMMISEFSGHIKKILKPKSEKSHAEKSEKSHGAESSRKTCSTKGSVVKVRTDKRENASPPQPSCGNNVKSWNCTQTATLSPLY